ncbi:MAG: hypothetical protein FE78DRAFT_29177 [Acidomyces sp. 'richmondensis']|uniref:Amidase domain-containing protein n=1 Tax=Sulfobacillus thermosulfidooxidans TaxID=28034 RepID=A0A2T2WT49_SULTH|nr:MAG: hypothetical protein FE78DRAFT_29177 [Acidomyces sp. 'richmondensis']PSR25416.1 MAG: hypothetical protein C7B47_12220 [Sulfobacillus thermosulfidooxidans]
MTLLNWPLRQIGQAIARKEVSPLEVTDSFITQIERLDPIIQAFALPLFEEARVVAQERTTNCTHNKCRSILDGIPIGIKDIFDVANIPTRLGSKIFEKYIPQEDATIIHHVKQAGMPILGKLTTHELAMGNRTPPTCNPWDTTRIPGGSSGGAAAAVAARLVPAAVGSDNAGSVRMPAALCGIVGFKPTYDTIDLQGMLSRIWSFDHAGPLGKTVDDVRLLYHMMRGSLEEVSTRSLAEQSPDYADRTWTIGIDWEWISQTIHPDVESLFRQTEKWFNVQGMHIRTVHLPYTATAFSIWMTIASAEAVTHYATVLRTSPEMISPEIRARLQYGQEISAMEYIQAQQLRKQLQHELLTILSDVDVLCTPTVSIPAPLLTEDPVFVHDQPISLFDATLQFTLPFNVVGFPAISIPIGLGELSKCPVGLQLVGKPYQDEMLLDIAEQIETIVGWRQVPSLCL